MDPNWNMHTIILYGSETWDTDQTQTHKRNQLLDNVIKRVMNLQGKHSTPRECI